MATCPQCGTAYPEGTQVCTRDGALLPQAFAPREVAPGDRIGDYRVEAKIGEGTFGKVYRVVQPVIGKRAAIKVLNPEYCTNPEWVGRFVDEARAVNQIQNRHIIDIFGFGTTPSGQHYFAMELLVGSTLERLLQTEGALPPAVAIPILRKVARALDAAHRAGIAHRDLKPENVFLCADDDGTLFPKLLDFGIAKLLDAQSSRGRTRTGTPMGTPLYMSPEQCRGVPVDHRTDVYALGVIAHEVLAGRRPFDGDNAMEVMLAHLQSAPPRLSQHAPHLSPALDAPLLCMLEKDPARRPASAGEAIEALARAASAAGYAVDSDRPGAPARRDTAAASFAPTEAFQAIAPMTAPGSAAGPVATVARPPAYGGPPAPAYPPVASFASAPATGPLGGGPAYGSGPVAPGYAPPPAPAYPVAGAAQTGPGVYPSAVGPVPAPPTSRTGLVVGLGVLGAAALAGVVALVVLEGRSPAPAPSGSPPTPVATSTFGPVVPGSLPPLEPRPPPPRPPAVGAVEVETTDLHVAVPTPEGPRELHQRMVVSETVLAVRPDGRLREARLELVEGSLADNTGAARPMPAVPPLLARAADDGGFAVTDAQGVPLSNDYAALLGTGRALFARHAFAALVATARQPGTRVPLPLEVAAGLVYLEAPMVVSAASCSFKGPDDFNGRAVATYELVIDVECRGHALCRTLHYEGGVGLDPATARVAVVAFQGTFATPSSAVRDGTWNILTAIAVP
ncbi:MAG: serine/threonine protein kinase [Polyangiaceae bacterium]|nr:serine/threonine protein kinase [Polyangiaceae bacterium]